MGDFIYEEFKERVQDFGITIGPEDQNGNIEIDYDQIHLTIKLGNARKSYEQHDDLTHLDRIIVSLHESLMGVTIPAWNNASPNLFFMLAQSEQSLRKGYITESIANGVVKVFILHHNGQYIRISQSILRYWNINLEVFKEAVVK